MAVSWTVLHMGHIGRHVHACLLGRYLVQDELVNTITQ